MSQSGLTAEHGVPWPSNGISEVPFRVYTDQDQYAREQERLFKGPTWNYLCLTVELANRAGSSDRRDELPKIQGRPGG